MAGFSADWLALREPADHAARSTALTHAVAEALARVAEPGILDLACGTGSNLRYLSNAGTERTRPTASERTRPTLTGRWLLVDHDADLLAWIPQSPDVETRCLDLSTLDDPSVFDGRSLVTASALLDLVSDAWLRALAQRCADGGAAVLFALNYDGRIICTPEDEDDGTIVALVNQHQRTEKGFGPALGPDATDRAVHWFRQHGYEAQRAPSDWTLTPASGELQRELIDGWTQAATEIAPEQARLIDRWRERRLAHLAAGWSHIVVGHEDVAAFR
jgi:SAM-dependent methyltransferase